MAVDENNSWRPLSWYCPNCGQKVTASQNNNGEFKVTCMQCKNSMVRIPKGRRHYTIELYAPKMSTSAISTTKENHRKKTL